MEDLLDIGQKVLASQPFSVFVGATLTKLEEGAAELQIAIKDELKQQHGFVHGGVLSYAADNAITFAGGSLLGARVVTAEFKINYLKPCVGERLVARASVVHRGKRTVVCRSEVYAVEGEREQLCALAQGTVSVLDSSV